MATYHSNIAGISNLYILDNYSNDQFTVKLLTDLESLGANVIRNCSFEHKGAEVSELVLKLESYEWCFPLDCDEFVCVSYDGKAIGGRDKILAELKLLDKDKQALRVERYIMNIPHTSRGYISEAKKIAIGGGVKTDLDLGYHLYDWEAASEIVPSQFLAKSRISYMHFHNKPFSLLLQAAKSKMSRRLKSFDRSTLENYTGDGAHLIPYFFMSEVEYLERFINADVDLGPAFQLAGLSVPFSSSALS